MTKNLVNLNVNPCKMCMPMGSVSAFYGIKGCMSILHGSQGCSTYIRRHMATHYNEPIDIASSSLTEEGTVFGGEKNLVKGLENLIKLYDPEVIGIATTCLAETIGEDIPRMILDFYKSHPDCKVKLISVSSSGYSGTQYEGFFAALKSIVSFAEMNKEKNNKINVITGMLTPADTRYLKKLLNDMGLEYVLLPDLSENLDGVYKPQYQRLPKGGTSMEEISQMAGARLTIELSEFVSDESSPAKYLHDTYGVPYVRCNMPVGLKDTDALIEILKNCGGTLTHELETERGRYLDAMIDSHKYNAAGRAVIFGEPDFVYSIGRLCLENGIIPVVAATGAKSEHLKLMLQKQIKSVCGNFFVEDFIVADNCDFDHIEEYALKYNANIMIGNSDGRRIEEKFHLPLIRCAFPIHDHVGGQRIRLLGYEGSVSLLDRVTNALLSKTEQTFRNELYEKYYDKPETPKSTAVPEASLIKEMNAEKSKTHPCFNGCGGGSARMHLPVAPNCNIQCNYCVRKFDCPNESRPGVSTRVLSPEEAVQKYLEVKANMPNLNVVGIAGPGDSLMDFDKTKKTLELIRKSDPDVTFCLSTNGLMLPQYADELVQLGVSHVTVTINSVDPKIGSLIYHHISYMGQMYIGEAAAAILLANQLAGLKMLSDRGVICKVNIVMLKGINDHHIPQVVKKVKELGCELTNIMQMIPVEGSAFEQMPLTSNKEIMEMRKACGETLQQMYHCRQCRADAVGTLDHDESALYYSSECSTSSSKDTALDGEKLLLFAVATKEGILVDRHFGHASDFYIYEHKEGSVRFKERRGIAKYCSGPEGCDGNGGGKENKEGKMEMILDAIKDCDCVIAIRVGDAPKNNLAKRGITVIEAFGRIEDAVNEAALKMTKEKRKEATV